MHTSINVRWLYLFEKTVLGKSFAGIVPLVSLIGWCVCSFAFHIFSLLEEWGMPHHNQLSVFISYHPNRVNQLLEFSKHAFLARYIHPYTMVVLLREHAPGEELCWDQPLVSLTRWYIPFNPILTLLNEWVMPRQPFD
jgi:hypothetical protein